MQVASVLYRCERKNSILNVKIRRNKKEMKQTPTHRAERKQITKLSRHSTLGGKSIAVLVNCN